MSYYCTRTECGKNGGWTNIGTAENQWWVCGRCHRPSRERIAVTAGGDTLLNYFRGGPIDNHAYSSKQMYAIGNDGSRVPIENYRWTPEIITSERTGVSARVWVYVGNYAPQPTSSPDTINKQAPKPMAKSPTERNTVSNLRERRDAVKASRTKVAELMGTTVPKVARIENDDAKKTTDEERAAFAKVLDQLEAEYAERERAEAEAVENATVEEDGEGPTE